MTPLEITVYGLLALFGIFISALYSGLETGVYTLNPVRLTVGAARREVNAVHLREMLRRPNRLLIALLIGTNVGNYLGSWAVAQLLHATKLTDWTLVAIEAVVITPVLFVVAETLPKDLFRAHTDRWTYWCRPVISLTRAAAIWSGLVPLVELYTRLIARVFRVREPTVATGRDRISQLVREGVGAGVLSPSQATLTERAMAMRGMVVGDTMVPWSRVVSVPEDAAGPARESLFTTRSFTRMPVVAADGRVAGILTWVDAVLERDVATRSLMQPALAFSPDDPLLEALSRMRHDRQPMAIVEDPRTGRPLGVVTLKNVVEPLTGRLSAW